MSSFFTRFKDEIADGYVLGPVRVVLGALLGWHALTAAGDLARIGYFGDVFHVSMLPEAFRGIPELAAPRETSLHPLEILRCLRLKVWDVELQRMVGFDDAMRKPVPLG